MTARILKVAVPVLGLVLVIVPLARAQRRGPPPEALEACSGREDGDDCTVEIGGRSVAGTCMAPPERPLACVPDRGAMPPPPEGEHAGPPPEALRACAGRSTGASCTVAGHEFTGECHAPPGLPLACVPPHHGMLPEALEACRGIAAGELCALDTPDGAREGACRATPEGTMCVLLPPRRPPASPS